MKLLELTYWDQTSGWGFEKFQFERDLTLLVGASGVGKTRVLRAIESLREIVHPNRSTVAPNTLRWEVRFEDDEGTECIWTGERGSSELGSPLSCHFVSESLTKGSTHVFRRLGQDFEVYGKSLQAKLALDESGIHLLNEDACTQVRQSLGRLLLVDALEEMAQDYPFNFLLRRSALERYSSLSLLRNSPLPTQIKLGIVQRKHPEVFRQILDDFRDVFPLVEHVSVDEMMFDDSVRSRIILSIRETGIGRLITQDEISQGMRRTLMHLARLALWPDGTVLLIDEFENGLGVNCIDSVARGLLSNSARLQFIATSHHPYIINQIPMDRWKILAREGGRIEAFTADQLHLGRSKHTAFTQLINSKVFRTGTMPDESLSPGGRGLNGTATLPGVAEGSPPTAPTG